MSSCVRPGVCEVRASAWRPVSALTSDDLPTLERPAKAISGAPTGGRLSHARRRIEKIAGLGEQLAARFLETALRRCHAGALRSILLRLSKSSIFTPARFMISDCWRMVSVLLHVQ